MRKSETQVAIWFLYVLGLAALAQFYVFPLVQSRMTAAAVQLGFYVVSALPALFLAPVLGLIRGTPRSQLLLGGAIVATALGWAGVIGTPIGVPLLLNAATAALAEEIIFRGHLWAEQQRFQDGLPLIALNVALFSLYHVPGWIAQRTALWQILLVPALGLVFAYLRHRTRYLTLPILVHLAVDIASA